MEWRFIKLFWLGVIVGFSLTYCSKSEDQINPIPVPTDPNPVPAPQAVPTTATKPDSRLPSWVSNASPIQLKTARDFSGLEDLFALIVIPPLVGDPSISMDLSGIRQSNVEGTLHLGFEDNKGFEYMDVGSVACAENGISKICTGGRNSSQFDGYFTDDKGVVRIVGSISGSQLSGQIYYRTRQNGEHVCEEVQCFYDWYGRPNYCHKITVDEITVCENYMGTSQGQNVKLLGTFNASYLSWFTK